MTRSSAAPAETWTDPELFQAAVAQERATRLHDRRVVCIIAWVLIAISIALVVLAVAGALFARSAWAAIVCWALVVALELNFLRLLRALSRDLVWPRPRPQFEPGKWYSMWDAEARWRA